MLLIADEVMLFEAGCGALLVADEVMLLEADCGALLVADVAMLLEPAGRLPKGDIRLVVVMLVFAEEE